MTVDHWRAVVGFILMVIIWWACQCGMGMRTWSDHLGMAAIFITVGILLCVFIVAAGFALGFPPPWNPQ